VIFSDNRGTYLDSLPEATDTLTVLVEFLDAIRKATSLAEVNVAAGIARARLMGLPS